MPPNADDHAIAKPPEDDLTVIYERMRALARVRLSARGPMSIQATDLANAAWVRIHVQGRGETRTSMLMMLAARAMRDELVEHARRNATAKRGGDWTRVTWESAAHVAVETPALFLELQDALAILEAETPDHAKVVHLRFHAGFTQEEIAKTLGIGTATVWRRWEYARARLHQLLSED